MAGADRGVSQAQAATAAAGVIAGWLPRAVSDAAAAFARQVVAAAAPGSPARAKALLFAAGRLAGFCEQRGVELAPAVVLSEASIERWVVQGTDDLAPASVRTLRSNLRALARALERYPQPAPAGLARDRAKAPYSAAQIDGYLRLADAQPTVARRMRASALICLGAGAGIVAAELRHLRGLDVVCRSGGVLVCLTGTRARSVPVLESYQARLLGAADFAGERLICGGREPGRRNITDELTGVLSADPGLPRLQAGRLRSTWLTECAARIGLAGFMQAAGIRCSQRLGDLAAQLPAVCEAELITLLGARA